MHVRRPSSVESELILIYLSKKAEEQAGKGAVSGAVRGVIGLPLDTTKRVIKIPMRKKKDVEEKEEKK